MASRDQHHEGARQDRREREKTSLAAERRGRLRGLAPAGLLVLAAVVALVVVLSSGGGGSTGPAAAEAADFGHVHGVGVDPRDDALFVATHNGLFRAGKGETRARPVGEPGKDVMGFTIGAPGRLLGSGHPGPAEKLPSNVGLIDSRDSGRTFRPVSLTGEVDFHVLRSGGGSVYGVDSQSGRLFASTDGGRNWRRSQPPSVLFDLAVDPSQPERLVGASEEGLLASNDAGRNWQRLGEQIALLAWPAPGQLFLLDADGRVARSADGGRSFQPAGRLSGEPAAFAASDSGLYVALSDGSVQRSGDGGVTWTLRARL